MDLGINGRVAVVVAASQGLGKTIAEHFLREGANVVLCARSETDLNQTRDQLAHLFDQRAAARERKVTPPLPVKDVTFRCNEAPHIVRAP